MLAAFESLVHLLMMDKCPIIKKKVLRKFRVIKCQNEISSNNQQVTLYSYVVARIFDHHFVKLLVYCHDTLSINKSIAEQIHTNCKALKYIESKCK